MAHCPVTQLLVIDAREGRECVVGQVACGFLEPMFFHDGMIKYSKIAKGMGERTVVHRRLDELAAWQRIAPVLSQGDSRGNA